MARKGEECDVVYKKSIVKMMKYHVYLLPLTTSTFLLIIIECQFTEFVHSMYYCFK